MSPGAVRTVSVVCLLGCLALVLHALVLGMHFEATPQALEEADKGRAVGYPAGLGAVAAVAGIAGSRRRWGVAAAAASVVLLAVALTVDVVR